MKTTMANCHSSVRNTDGVDTGVQGRPVTSDTGKQLVQYSINNLVDQVHRLQRLCWHMVLLWKVIVVLIRWEVPFVTLSFWIVSLLICYFMESGQLLVSCLSFLFLLGMVGGVAKLNSQEPKTAKEPSSTAASPGTAASSVTTPQEKEQSSTQDAEHHQRKGREVLVEYRQLMLLAQDYLKVCCEALQRVNEVLGWQNTTLSSVCYGGASLTLLLLYLLPLRWCVMAAISSVLCINQHFIKVIKELGDSSHRDPPLVTNNNKPSEKKLKEFKDMVPEEGSKDQVPTDVKSSIHPLIEHRPLHLCQKSKSLDEAGPNYAKLALAAATRNRSSTAPELPTLRLNSAGTPVEVCYLCGTMFSAVLKRRRYCRSCGNQFCQRCCSRKLPRSTFGATSPAAQTEKELVCNACFCNMTSDEVTSLSSGPTIEEC
ncbi:protrudin-like isoform X1 [Asterias amurensis]|uniref:protrudin-like isoform X1 n=1 Tax=Asterias amurensis TaxID=7602 RepID=UPI003AB7F717